MISINVNITYQEKPRKGRLKRTHSPNFIDHDPHMMDREPCGAEQLATLLTSRQSMKEKQQLFCQSGGNICFPLMVALSNVVKTDVTCNME